MAFAIGKLFNKRRDYEFVLIALPILYTLLMSFFFKPEWADSKWAVSLIDRVAAVVPVVRNIKNYLPAYSNYLGIFYAGCWLFAPLALVVGWHMEKYLNPQNSIVNTSLWAEVDPSHLFKYIIGLGILIFLFCMPIQPNMNDWRQNALSGGLMGRAFNAFIFMATPAYAMIFTKKIIKIILLRE